MYFLIQIKNKFVILQTDGAILPQNLLVKLNALTIICVLLKSVGS